jgi:hypothetical protein
VASAAFPPEQGGFHKQFREGQPLMPFLQGGERFSLLLAELQLFGHWQGSGLEPGRLGFQ